MCPFLQLLGFNCVVQALYLSKSITTDRVYNTMLLFLNDWGPCTFHIELRVKLQDQPCNLGTRGKLKLWVSQSFKYLTTCPWNTNCIIHFPD